MRRGERSGFMNAFRSLLFDRKNAAAKTGSTDEGRGSNFVNVGFHGDRYLLQLVHLIIPKCQYFVETGTNVGSTLAYVGKTYPQLKCISCEPDEGAYAQAAQNTEGLKNVRIYNETSQNFLQRLDTEYRAILKETVLFWLDAHGYGFQWPLKDELSFITGRFTSAFILIDDFKVPGFDCFGYDVDRGQECSLDYTKDSLNPDLYYNLYYPAYTERTSLHHPLRGWGLIEYGHDALILTDALRGKITSNLRIRSHSQKESET